MKEPTPEQYKWILVGQVREARFQWEKASHLRPKEGARNERVRLVGLVGLLQEHNRNLKDAQTRTHVF